MPKNKIIDTHEIIISNMLLFKNIFIIVANIIPISPIKNIVENLDKSVFVV